MTQPTFGISFIRSDDDKRPMVQSDMSIIGLVLPSSDADQNLFPLNMPVEFNSSDAAYLVGAGTGDLYRALVKINNQLGDFQVAARIVAVRVAQGANKDATIANIVGDLAQGTGLYALLKAQQLLGVTPRLIGAPGYTGIAKSGISAIALNVGGSGYTTAPNVVFSGGNGTGAEATALLTKGIGALTLGVGGAGYATEPTVTIGAPDEQGGIQATAVATIANGAVTGFTITNKGSGYLTAPAVTLGAGATQATATAALTGIIKSVNINSAGVGYTSSPSVSFTGGSGTGAAANATVGYLANPICAALPPILSALLANAVVSGSGTGKAAALKFRQTLNSGRLIAIDTWDIVQVGTNSVEEDGAAAALGIMVRCDFERGGVPSKSPANQPVQGILGLKQFYSFSLTDGATEGQELLAAGVGIVERGEQTSESSISASGFTLIATDNCDPDPIWQMINVSRVRDFTHLALLKSIRLRLGRTNITGHGIQAVLNDMNTIMSELKAGDHIIGFEPAGFDPDKNNPENLRLGKIRLYFKQEEAPTLKNVTIDSKRDRAALTRLLGELISQANTLTA
jgi:uncharacterized protein